MKTEWNYSELAKPYLNRPDYSRDALDKLFNILHPTIDEKQVNACDVGAGVAHLTIPLLSRGFIVDAVEPNNEMRKLGAERTKEFSNVVWYEGSGESTGLKASSYNVVTFGSSFNVTDRQVALQETNRILKPKGWFVCMWNHRDLDDKIQTDVENIIKNRIPNYSYGTRREDQTNEIEKSSLFKEVGFLEGKITHTVLKTDWLDAWRSHATLARQAKDKFNQIIDEIEVYLKGIVEKEIQIPYTTRIWFAQKNT